MFNFIFNRAQIFPLASIFALAMLVAFAMAYIYLPRANFGLTRLVSRFRNCWPRSAGAFAVLILIAISVPAIAASPSVTLVVPSGQVQSQIIGASGTAYAPSTNGQISVSNADDVRGFLGAGYMITPSGATPATLKFLEFKNTDGTTMTASASSGKFALTVTPGTSEVLTGEAATGATKTDAAILEYVLPSTYVAGQPLTVTVSTGYSGSGTAGASTIAVAAYLAAASGSQGSNLVTTSATSLTAAAQTAYKITVPGGSLSAGSKLMLKVTLVTIESGGSAALTGTIGSVTVG